MSAHRPVGAVHVVVLLQNELQETPARDAAGLAIDDGDGASIDLHRASGVQALQGRLIEFGHRGMADDDEVTRGSERGAEGHGEGEGDRQRQDTQGVHGALRQKVVLKTIERTFTFVSLGKAVPGCASAIDEPLPMWLRIHSTLSADPAVTARLAPIAAECWS